MKALVCAALLAAACQTEDGRAVGDQKAGGEPSGAKVQPAGKIAVACKGGSQIDPALRKQIFDTARGTYDKLRGGDLDALWASLHPQARSEDQRDAFMDAMRVAGQRLSGGKGEPTLEHIHFVDVEGGASALTRVQCGDAQDPGAFELLANAGDEDIGVATFITQGDPFAFATTLQLRRRGDAWRLLGVQVQPAGYRGKGPEAFETQAETLTKDQKFVAGYLAFAVASQLAARGSAVKPVRQARIEQKLAALESSPMFKAELGPWEVGGRTYDVAGITLASTKSDLSPVIKYVTPGGLVRDVLDNEADQLLGYVKGRYPEIAGNFDAVVFEAYAEPPTEPNREYEAYRIARYFTRDPSGAP